MCNWYFVLDLFCLFWTIWIALSAGFTSTGCLPTQFPVKIQVLVLSPFPHNSNQLSDTQENDIVREHINVFI